MTSYDYVQGLAKLTCHIHNIFNKFPPEYYSTFVCVRFGDMEKPNSWTILLLQKEEIREKGKKENCQNIIVKVIIFLKIYGDFYYD